MGEDYAEEEEDEDGGGADPTVGYVGGGFVEVALVDLRRAENVLVGAFSFMRWTRGRGKEESEIVGGRG